MTGHVVPPAWAHRERPIVFNTWEATWFDVDHRRVMGLAKQAKRLGMELFLLDDGWFGCRDDDTSSLGDWTPHPRKLPRGWRAWPATSPRSVSTSGCGSNPRW